MEVLVYILTFLASTKNLLSILFCTLCTAYLHYKWRRRELEALGKKLPGPRVWPFFGSAIEFINLDARGLSKKVIGWSKIYPSPARIWFGPVLGICLFDPENVEIVLKSPITLEKDRIYDFLSDYFGDGLLTAPVEKWKRSRKLLGPAFNTKLISSFMGIFNEKNRLLIKKLEKELVPNKVFDAYEYISEMSLEAVCQAALGLDFDFQSDAYKEFLETFTLMSKLVYARGMKIYFHWKPLWLLFGPRKDIKRVDECLQKFVDNIVAVAREKFQERKASGEDDSEKKGRFMKSFIEILLQISDDGANYTDKDIRDEILTMVFGATDTSSTAESYFLLMMAMNPDLQDKVYQEINEVVGDRDITVEDCGKLVYLEQAIKETLRLFPSVPVIWRTNTERLKLTNCELPPGCNITLGLLRLQRDPVIYPEPDKFDPDRMTPEKIASRHPFSFVPFSAGLRGCIGTKYAMFMLKVTLCNILRNFKVSSPWKSMDDIEFQVEAVLRPVGGYPISITRRNP